MVKEKQRILNKLIQLIMAMTLPTLVSLPPNKIKMRKYIFLPKFYIAKLMIILKE